MDEFYYVVGEPIQDLKERLSTEDMVDREGVEFRIHNVPLLLDDGRGYNRYWFNFMELVWPDSVGSPPAADP